MNKVLKYALVRLQSTLLTHPTKKSQHLPVLPVCVGQLKGFRFLLVINCIVKKIKGLDTFH